MLSNFFFDIYYISDFHLAEDVEESCGEPRPDVIEESFKGIELPPVQSTFANCYTRTSAYHLCCITVAWSQLDTKIDT